ncbi:MAG: inositol monophosphatase [Clostridia bacterium]|nr:inositol monophosphatase [Clostridia bacterium]NLF20825.1 inositol monophosphatase [Clostridiaceae bacterium]
MNFDLERLQKIVRTAGDGLRQAVLAPEDVMAKAGHQNFATLYDQKTQDFLEAEFALAWPDFRFIAEEQEVHQGIGEGPCFIVDPIDGTSNFIHSVPISAISVAVVMDGKVRVGVVYNPFMNEMYWAEEGRGAWLNGKHLICPDLPMELSLFCVGMSPYYAELMPQTLRLMAEVQKRVTDLRRFGAASLDLCYIASGRQGGFCEWRLQPWDFAAGQLIAREAGAIVTTMDGEEAPLDKATSLLAAGPRIYKTFREEIDLATLVD